MLIGEIDQQNAVLGHEPHQHDDADHRHDVDVVAGDQQRDRHANEAERQREHDRQRLEKRAEQRGENEIDEDHGEKHCLEHVARCLLQILHVAAKNEVVAGRQADFADRTTDVFGDVAHRVTRQHVGVDRDLLLEIASVYLLRSHAGLHLGHL